MVMARGACPSFTATASTAPKRACRSPRRDDASGTTVWQIGGQVAEDGVGFDRETLIAHTQAELLAVMPALNLAGTEWATYRVDRAEGATASGGRPESFRLLHEGARAHRLADEIGPRPATCASRAGEDFVGRQPARCVRQCYGRNIVRLAAPTVALPPWERPQTWTPYAARCAAA